jgi:hypothetical protein
MQHLFQNSQKLNANQKLNALEGKLTGMELGQREMLEKFKKTIEENQARKIEETLRLQTDYRRKNMSGANLGGYGSNILDVVNPSVFADIYYERHKENNKFDGDMGQFKNMMSDLNYKLDNFEGNIDKNLGDIRAKSSMESRQLQQNFLRRQQMQQFYSQPENMIGPPPDAAQFGNLINTMPLFSNNPNQLPIH